jgi:Tol biopolymer transport system component
MPSVHYGIYLMDADGGNRVRLSSPEAKNDRMPAWSPERCRIAFVRFSGTGKGDDDIYEMSADGKTIHRLTTDPGRDTFPDWSPDSRQISFISDRDGSRNLFVMDADGGNQRQLTDQQQLPRTARGYVQWQQWSPDGQEKAFTYNPGTEQGTSLYIIRPDGDGLRQLVDRAAEPAWSPDGQKIYFFSNRTGQVEIWVINRDGTELKQVSSVYGIVFPDHSLRVSPDGRKLAFYGTGPEVTEYGTEIYVINVDGSGLNNISHAKGQDESEVQT